MQPVPVAHTALWTSLHVRHVQTLPLVKQLHLIANVWKETTDLFIYQTAHIAAVPVRSLHSKYLICHFLLYDPHVW